MDIRTIETDHGRASLCSSETVVIRDGQSALEFIVNIGFAQWCHKIAIHKSAICEDFFNLSTGLAGEVAQKFVNYKVRVAIIGDFSGYTSTALRDYMYECNKGGPLYFVRDEGEASAKLGA